MKYFIVSKSYIHVCYKVIMGKTPLLSINADFISGVPKVWRARNNSEGIHFKRKLQIKQFYDFSWLFNGGLRFDFNRDLQGHLKVESNLWDTYFWTRKWKNRVILRSDMNLDRFKNITSEGHPRSYMSSWSTRKLDLGFDLYSFLMHSRRVIILLDTLYVYKYSNKCKEKLCYYSNNKLNVRTEPWWG